VSSSVCCPIDCAKPLANAQPAVLPSIIADVASSAPWQTFDVSFVMASGAYVVFTVSAVALTL
jgi:hypothetical protein